MSDISFELVHKYGDLIRKSDSLKDIWKYIKTDFDEPKNYEVDEIDNYGIIATMSAYMLIENFKTEESLPTTLTNIK